MKHLGRLLLEKLEPRPLLSVEAPPGVTPSAPRRAAAGRRTQDHALWGFEISPGEISGDVRHGATFMGKTDGPWPAFWSVAIDYRPMRPGPGVTHTIVGSNWKLVVFSRGVLYGKGAAGTVCWDAAGAVAAISATLSVTRATGAFAGVSDAATFTGTLSHRTLPPSLGGRLRLTV
jgi:hypothetical protein